MIRTNKARRAGLFRHGALTLGLALGVATGPLAWLPAQAAAPKAPKMEFSPAFSKAAAELDKSLSEATKNASVQALMQQVRAAKDPQAKAAAVAQVDTALGGGKAKLDAATAAASTPADKLKLGEMTRTYGVLSDDVALQNRGLIMMMDSGVLPPQASGQVRWLAGVTAYQMRDYVNAAKFIQQAKDGGFADPQLDAVLADSYKRSNNPAAALQVAQRDLAAARAAGTKPSEASIRTALQAAYDAKQVGPSMDLAVELAQNYPSQQAWNSSINVVRALSGFQSAESLDLMRLMGRTNSYADERDYVEYLQAVDARRFPGEAQKIIDTGTAAGKLRANDRFVVEARQVAATRIAADRAGLPAFERDARSGSATGATVTGAADAFLSYGDAAKAEALYTIALNKSGTNRDLVLTRLGIAQVDQGKTAEALATFAKVQGNRKPIALLWSAYARQKGGAAQ